jgi:ethanolamine ammonia-lyase small subunit
MADEPAPRRPGPIPAHPRLQGLARFADARIALGRAGAGLPTAAHLRFTLDHARARDAVYSSLDTAPLLALAHSLHLPAAEVVSEAGDRATYVRRPDLGRRLAPSSLPALASLPRGRDVVLVMADGLSAAAVNLNAEPVLRALVPALQGAGLTTAGVVIAREARVALGDAVALAVEAKLVILLVGERPGLSAADSLGAYLTYDARPGTPDSRRNCVSNIRSGGLAPAEAARRLAWLAAAMVARGISGVGLKDESDDPRALPAG